MKINTINGGRVAWIGVTVLAFSLSAGCANDPFSQRRIQRRTDHLREVAAGIEKHEADGPRRVQYRLDELNRKNATDAARFNDRVKRVGDYVW